MCYYVFVSVPDHKRTTVEQLEVAGLSVWAADNPSLNDVFPPGHTVFEITSGGCSCDLYEERDVGESEDKLRSRYQRKGWSCAKIERTLESKRRSGGLGGKPIYRTFQKVIRELVLSAGEVGLFAHWFGGDLHEGKLVARDECRCNLTDYEERAGVYAQDTLLLVVRGAG